MPAFLLTGLGRAGPWLFRLLALLAVGLVAKWLGLDSEIAGLLELVLR